MRPRIIVSGATTAITRRTTCRKAFLAPWSPEVVECWKYSVACAQQDTGVAVHHGVLVINHQVLIVTPSCNNLPKFTRRVVRDMSCSVNTLLTRERYDAPRELFDSRDPHYMRLLDAEAQASHLIYQDLNCVAAGLVERPEHMSDYVFDFGLWKTGRIEVERPDVYFSKDRPERATLLVTPPPLLYEAFNGDIDRLIHHMNGLRDDALKVLRTGRTRPVQGAQLVRQIHPWTEPKTLRERGGQPAPTFRIGARGIVGRQRRIDAAGERTAFVARHEEARRKRLAGDPRAEFPYGTYAMHVHHGARVEPRPPDGAQLAMPGPLLCDVKAELAARSAGEHSDYHDLVDTVRGAFAQEADQVVAHCMLDLASGRRAADLATATSSEHGPDTVVHLRHRFDRPVRAGQARRIITLRDRRRGRPPGGRHGSDPPA